MPSLTSVRGRGAMAEGAGVTSGLTVGGACAAIELRSVANRGQAGLPKHGGPA